MHVCVCVNVSLKQEASVQVGEASHDSNKNNGSFYILLGELYFYAGLLVEDG